MKSKIKDKRILLLVSTDITFDQRVHRTAKTLADLGANVSIIGRQLSGSVQLDWDGIDTERISLSFQSGPGMYFMMNKKMVDVAGKGPWDIVVSNDFDTLLAGYRISRTHSSAWILDSHEHFIEVPELRGRPFKRYAWHALGLWATNRLDAAYTVSDSLARILSSTYNIDFSVIENRPLLRSNDTEVTTQTRLLFYQGALNRGRGLENAIIAMRGMPNYKLQIAGDGDIKDELAAIIRRYHLSDRVELLGRISPDELDKFTAQAWLGLNLLEGNSLNYYYSLANKFFDYAQWGVPSINPAFPEYIKYHKKFGGCLLLEDQSSKSLQSKIFELEDDPKAYDQLKAGALEMKNHCHWDTQTQKLERIYSDVLEE